MYTYVISNEIGNLYVGITSNLERRLKQHRSGKTKSLKGLNKDWNYIHVWEMPSYILASHLERFLHKLPDSSVLDVVLDWPEFCRCMHKELIKIPPTDYEVEKDRKSGESRNQTLLRARLLRRIYELC